MARELRLDETIKGDSSGDPELRISIELTEIYIKQGKDHLMISPRQMEAMIEAYKAYKNAQIVANGEILDNANLLEKINET